MSQEIVMTMDLLVLPNQQKEDITQFIVKCQTTFFFFVVGPVHEKYAFWPMYFVKYSTNTGLLYCICTFCTFCVLFKTNPGFSFLCNGYFVRPEIGSKVPAF
jgi:hypothetical protein